MRVIGVDEALVIALKDPSRLRKYDYVMDEGAWFIPAEEFLDWLLEKRPATARAVGVIS